MYSSNATAEWTDDENNVGFDPDCWNILAVSEHCGPSDNGSDT